MPTQQTSKVSNRFSKLRNNDARLTPDFKDNSPQRCKKRSQKTKFRMAYKVTMHSMPNLPKGLIWGIKWNAIKFWANYPVLRTFHPKDRIPSDPPTFCKYYESALSTRKSCLESHESLFNEEKVHLVRHILSVHHELTLFWHLETKWCHWHPKTVYHHIAN